MEEGKLVAIHDPANGKSNGKRKPKTDEDQETPKRKEN